MISLEVLPLASSSEGRFVALTRTRPRQSETSASACFACSHRTHKITISCIAASLTVPALAFGPILRTSPLNVSGPLLLLSTTSCPCRTKYLAYVCATVPAPIKPNFIRFSLFRLQFRCYKSIYLDQKKSLPRFVPDFRNNICQRGLLQIIFNSFLCTDQNLAHHFLDITAHCAPCLFLIGMDGKHTRRVY